MKATATSIKSWFGIFLSALCLTLFPPSARAHDPGLSTATITVGDQQIDVLLGFNQKDAETLLGPQTHSSVEDIEAIDEPLATIATKEMELYLEGRLTVPSQAIGRHFGNQNVEVLLRFERRNATNLRAISTLIGKLPFGHREFLSIRTDRGATLGEAMLSAQADMFQIELPGNVDLQDTTGKVDSSLQSPEATDRPAATVSGHSFIAFLGLGIEHILTGYDHLLFLFALLVVCRNLRSILTVISCFTIAHSITLALAALEIVRLPGRIVEPLIAASIAYVGIENLVQGRSPKWRWLITLLFGLIHGLGFADALREFGIGGPGPGIVLPLVGFNLGVEIGQLSVAAIILPMLWCLRKQSFLMHRLAPVCSVGIVVAGSYWMIERILGP